MPETPLPRSAPMRRIPIAVGAVLAGVLIGYAAVYGIGSLLTASRRSGIRAAPAGAR